MRVVGVDLDVVAHGRGREEAVRRARLQAAVRHDRLQHRLRVVEHFLAPRPPVGFSRIRGYVPRSSHAAKNGDQSMYGTKLGERDVGRCLAPVNSGRGGTYAVQSRGVRRRRASSRLSSGCSFWRASCWVFRRACSRAVLGLKRRAPDVAFELADHAHRARGVPHVDHGPAVRRRDLHRGVHLARGGAADQQRQREPLRAASRSRRAPSRRATA